MLCYLLFLSMGYVAGLADRRMAAGGNDPAPLGTRPQDEPVEKLLSMAERDPKGSGPDQDTSTEDHVFVRREVAC
jgi:hypothetical protein